MQEMHNIQFRNLITDNIIEKKNETETMGNFMILPHETLVLEHKRNNIVQVVQNLNLNKQFHI